MRVKNSWHIDILQHILYHAHLLKQNGSDKLQDSISSHVLNQATQKLLLFFLFPNRLQSWGGGVHSCWRSISKTPADHLCNMLWEIMGHGIFLKRTSFTLLSSGDSSHHPSKWTCSENKEHSQLHKHVHHDAPNQPIQLLLLFSGRLLSGYNSQHPQLLWVVPPHQ